MGKENIGNKDELGIRVPLGHNIIMASFTLSHNNPEGKSPVIDLTAKRSAVWLTGQEEEIGGKKYNFIIGPDGLSSPIAIHWRTDLYPEIYIREHDEMIKLETENLPAAYLNHQLYHRVTSISKHYPGLGLRENYTVIHLPPNSLGKEQGIAQEYFRTNGTKPTLISGMNNRGLGNRLLTSFWALRLTQIGRPDLPFGRNLR
jgi:hypothetical protein